MGRFTFFDAIDQATFSDLFSDSSAATWYQLWTGNLSGEGAYVDTSAFNSFGKGWIKSDDLDRLEVDFAHVNDTVLWVRPWDGTSVKEPWEFGNVDFTGAGLDYRTSVIGTAVSMDEMFFDSDISKNTWYRLWIGDSDGTVGSYVDTSSLNKFGNGWVTPENLSGLTFSLSDAGKDLWVQTWVSETADNAWEHWRVQKEFTVETSSVYENAGTAVFTVTLPQALGEDETLIMNYSTMDNSAVGGSDFSSSSGSLVFEAGDIQKEILIPIIDDIESGEENEIFQLKVYNSLESYIPEVTASCTIIDNDDTINESISTPVKEGAEFKINTQTDYNQEDPCVTTLTDGGFVVVWESENQDGSEYGIYGQQYDKNGNALDNEFRVNTYTDSFQWAPAVAPLSGGGFVVVWQSIGQDGSGYGVMGQRYDVGGNMAGGEFQINTHTGFNQESPSVASLSEGGFVVTWQSAGQDGSGYGVYGQIYDSIGDPVGTEFLINTMTDDNQDSPFVISIANGGFVAAWASDDQDGSGYGIYGQLYDSLGNVSGSEFLINTTTDNDQKSCSGTLLADGGFLIVWTSYGQDGSGHGIYGQRFDGSGAAVDTEFRVNNYTFSNQEAPSVSSLADGGYVVAWESYSQDGFQEGVYGQRFDGSGQTIGEEFLINSTTTADQDAPSVAPLFDKGFVVAWGSDDQDGSFEGVYGQIFSIVSAEPLNNSFQENTYAGMLSFEQGQDSSIELTGVQKLSPGVFIDPFYGSY